MATMLGAAASLVVGVRTEDDAYRWTLSRSDGRVVDQGVELFIASCLTQATLAVDPASRISIVVDDFPGGEFLAARTQLDAATVALEIAQAMLSRR